MAEGPFGFLDLLPKVLAHPCLKKCVCGVLYVPTRAMEKFRNLGMSKVLGVLVLASCILGFLLYFVVYFSFHY